MTGDGYLDALHEAGHAIVGKAVGHEVYVIHIGDECYCDGGYPGNSPHDRRLRALVALGGYFAAAMYGQGRGYCVSAPWGWVTAEQDWEHFLEYRGGMTYRHARKKVVAILTARRDELLALAERVHRERHVLLDPHPSDEAILAVAL